MRPFIYILLFFSTYLIAKPIAETKDNISPLLVGQSAPKATITTLNGEQLEFDAFLNEKKTILFFYRGGWCPFCNTQMGQLKIITPELKALGYRLVGVSTDSPEMIKKSMTELQLDYELVSDFNSQLSQAFGIAYFTDQKTTARYVSQLKLTNPLQVNKENEKRLVLPAPSVYVIDESGTIQFNYVNTNYKVRLSPEILVSVAKHSH